MKVGVLTGGGDCPGLNAALRGVVYRAHQHGDETVGFLDGWKGVRDGEYRPLALAELVEAAGRGGTILGSSRTNPFQAPDGIARVGRSLRAAGVDALVAVGGDDTLSAALELSRHGGKVVGVPKTMDNDVNGTDWTFGFDSAASVAMDAVERLRDTARSHHRVVVLEVMGRHAGWVALATGLAAAADFTVLPEEPYDEGRLVRHVRAALAARGYAVVVASEGAAVVPTKGSAGGRDDFQHEILRERGVGAFLARQLEAATGVEARSAQIGHIQRGGAPTLFDRLLSLRLGAKAADLAHDGQFGQVAVLRGAEVVGIPLADAVASPKVVPPAWLDLLHTFDA